MGFLFYTYTGDERRIHLQIYVKSLCVYIYIYMQGNICKLPWIAEDDIYNCIIHLKEDYSWIQKERHLWLSNGTTRIEQIVLNPCNNVPRMNRIIRKYMYVNKSQVYKWLIYRAFDAKRLPLQKLHKWYKFNTKRIKKNI